jgi:glutathione peroxidase
MVKKIILTAFIMLNLLNITAQDNVYGFAVKTLQDENADLSVYKGKVVLIVNTASKCGLTPQYEGLEALYRKYKDKGLEIFGFPCNQFAGQEPGTAEEIASFCTLKYDVNFPLFEKIEVNGGKAHPLYVFLKKRLPLEGNKNDIRWNFEKFLVGRDGVPVKRFAPQTKPEAIEQDIIEALAL